VIVGIGLDLIETARIERSLKNEKFLRRIYTPQEQAYLLKRKMNAQTAAGIFAAKEAVSKALGTGFGHIRWLDVEIIKDDRGKPCVNLKGSALERLQALGGKSVFVSITHIKDLAAAQAVIESE
jgi:holo-[acyl-carrier protein] synthase